MIIKKQNIKSGSKKSSNNTQTSAKKNVIKKNKD